MTLEIQWRGAESSQQEGPCSARGRPGSPRSQPKGARPAEPTQKHPVLKTVFPRRGYYCPLPQFTYSENGPEGTEQDSLQNSGDGLTTNKIPSPPLALRQNHFCYCETGLSGCWLLSGALRDPHPGQGLVLGGLALTGHASSHPQEQWYLHLSLGPGEGTAGQPHTPGLSRLLSLLKKQKKTLETHVLYDGRKKYLMFPQKRQYILYFVKC